VTHCVQMIPLFSGSSGNAVFFQFGETRFLVDAGVSCKRITEALHRIGERPESLNGIFITHDHSDHVQGLDVFVRKYEIPIYATADTWRGIHAFSKKPHDRALDHEIFPGESFFCKDVEVLSFSTPHDAVGSVGYRFQAFSHSFSIATDMGFFSDEIMESIKGSSAVMLEANYDHEMLWNGPYPWPLKKRVDGKNGHLCNVDCAEAISRLIESGTRTFMLAHLSQENNAPRIARREVVEYLKNQNFSDGVDYDLFVAKRSDISEAVVLSGEPLLKSGVQMDLLSLLEPSGGTVPV